jgi:DNA-binding NarL/FixJ family response regulator
MSSDGPIRVVVADDHPMFRAGLRAMVEDSPDLDFVGEAADGTGAVAVCQEQTPDVVLMDVRMPGLSGVEAARRIRETVPSVAVLMLTMLEDDTSLLAALRAGAHGYLLKGAAPEEILRAVTAVASGQVLLGAELATRLAGIVGPTQSTHPFPELSLRERDVLELVADGRANQDIARRLGLSEKTVRNNVSAIFAKLRVVDRPAAIIRARDAGLGRRAGA